MRFRVSTRRPPAVAAILATAVFVCAPALTAGAQEQPGPQEQPEESAQARQQRIEKEKALEAVRRDIEAQREAEARLAAEIETLGKDRAALNQQLIETAARVQEIEATIDGVEERIEALQQREDALRASFRSRSGLLAELLGALERMGRRPPPAVLVEPSDALKTVRTAILLGAVLPGVRIETEAPCCRAFASKPRRSPPIWRKWAGSSVRSTAKRRV